MLSSECDVGVNKLMACSGHDGVDVEAVNRFDAQCCILCKGGLELCVFC